MEGVVPIAPAAAEHRESAIAREARFRRLCAEVEPRLRRALVAAYGADLGSDAAAEALTWAWEHFDRVERMANPAGYLWRVGQSSTRRELRHRRRRSRLEQPAPPPAAGTNEFEPGLAAALGSLSARQRTAVLLVHGHGYTLAEAATQMDCRIRTLRNHLDRGLRTLRAEMGVGADG